MNLNNFIYFGDFTIKEAYLKECKRGYTGELFLNIAKDSNSESEEYIGVILVKNEPIIDLVKIERYNIFFNISGEIYKNPKTHKILYIVKDSNNIELLQED